ncbi:GALK1 [Cordylochernes scorpioides]|uniref:GALK1 n=1 Tax=Cordylochernes scorpioides TaxID=51811 RepID=A0ABY6LHP0_9ARAC|nr:GALK1 [Cordylochernes scorpioides]
MESLNYIPFNELVKIGVKEYINEYGSKPKYCGYAPGRVNLIGEHTDYNDGFVFPMALPMATLVVGSRLEQGPCRIKTICPHADEPHTLSLTIPPQKYMLPKGKPHWLNYVKGVMANFNDGMWYDASYIYVCHKPWFTTSGCVPGPLYPFSCVIVTSLPVGAGLSSSASLEASVHMFLDALCSGEIQHPEGTANTLEKIISCYRAEHDYANVPCGIMDQFITFMGKENKALLLDCRSREYSYHELPTSEAVVLLINSNVRHQLCGSEYATRRQQCTEASSIMGHYSLRLASLDNLKEFADKLGPVLHRRAKHVITEINRTLDAAQALQNQDVRKFGILMNQSHESLRDDYEVSCPEVDELVALAQQVEGVYGARMTGGGFGGCVVALVAPGAVEKTKSHIEANYKREARPDFYIVTPSAGADYLDLSSRKEE